MRPVLFVELAGSAGSAGSDTGDAAPSALPPISEIEIALKRGLEAYKVPREVVLVAAVPRSATGKASRRALERLWREGTALADLGRGPLGCRFRRLTGAGPGLETTASGTGESPAGLPVGRT
jgi:hypothetical protein